ncbi:MAG: hypothetical protein P1Q69_16160 [Candidatus Thorarchaeota archaeon]|nr:hypothetical protein [Candidatus Thorarchaeota archaeon]
MALGSKYFGWLLALIIVLAAGWFLLPAGYNTLVLWLAPELGNWIRPTLVLVNIMLVDVFTNWMMVIIWAIAGFIGGVLARTKKGGFVVGLFTWLSALLILVFCVYQLFMSGLDMGSIPPIPPGSSLVDILGIPLIQSAIGELLPLISGIGGGGGGFDIMALLTPLIIWFVTPLIVVIVAAIIGGAVRPKERL